MEEQNGQKDKSDLLHVEDAPGPKQEATIDIGVEFNLKSNTVILKVGKGQISFSIDGARNLALRLRQAANMVEKHAN